MNEARQRTRLGPGGRPGAGLFRLGRVLAVAASLLCAAAAETARSAVTTESEAWAYYEKAIVHFDDGRLNAAVIELKNALKEDPGHLPARVLIGRTYLALNDGASAEKELRRAREGGADDALTLIPLAEAFLNQRKFRSVLTEIRPGGRSSGLEAQILYVRGVAQLSLFELDEAERSFAASARLDSGYVEPLVGRARVRIKTGDWDSAAGLLDRAVGMDPESVEARYHRGAFLNLKRDYKSAAEDLTAAIKAQPAHLPSRTERAAALLALGASDVARRDLEVVLGFDPGDPFAAYYLSKVLEREGDRAEAVAYLKGAEYFLRNLEPGFVETYPRVLLISAQVFSQLGDLAEARRNAEAFVGLDPYHPPGRKLLGRIMLQQGQADAAARVLEPATWLTPEDPTLLALLGTAMMRSGRFERATEMLEKAVELAPNYAPARAQLGLNRLAAGRYDQAITELEQALDLSDNPARTGAVLAAVHLSRRDYDAALAVAQTMIEREPENPAAYNFAGGAYLGLGDRAAARASFERALAIEPGFRKALINLAHLDEHEGKLESAKSRYLQMLAERPEDTESMLSMANIAEREERFDDAIAWLEKVRNTDRGNVAAHVRLVNLYLDVGEAETAVTLAREIREENGETIPILEMHGRAELAAGESSKAAGAFFRLAELSRDSPTALHRAAKLQMASGDSEGTHMTLSRTVVAFPDYLPARLSIIEVESRMGQTESALRRLDELGGTFANIDPAALAGLRAEVLIRARRFDEGLVAFREAFEARPTSKLLIGLYLASRDAGEPLPIERLERWLADNPEDRAVEKLLASAYMESGRWNEARAAHERLLARDPDDPMTHNNLAWLYHRDGEARALAFAEKAFALAPNEPSVLDTLGWILVERGQTERGLAMLREAHSRDSENPTIVYHIAVALERLGRSDQARRELEELFEAGGDFENAAEARALLDRLSGS